jgi:hypothetical protein
MGTCGARAERPCLRRGAAAHPPLPLEARYNPPRAAGIRDLAGDPSRGTCARGSPGWEGQHAKSRREWRVGRNLERAAKSRFACPIHRVS